MLAVTTAAVAGFLMLMSPVDPHAIHPGAPHASFGLQGYDFTPAKKTLPVPAAVVSHDGADLVHFAFTAPITGRCEIFELVNNQGVKNVAFPWGEGDGQIAIKGHKINVDLTLHTDAELHANGMSRDRPAIGMDCWKMHDEEHTVFSTIYQLQPRTGT